MSKPDYTAFDAELLNQINAGNNRTKLLCDQKRLLNLAKPFCTYESPEWRIIDRRLQALRKKGKIRFDGIKWETIDGGDK